MLLLAGLLWWVALLLFVQEVRHVGEADLPLADGVAVLTGGSGRIEEAMTLFKTLPHGHLLVSGAGEGVKLYELYASHKDSMDPGKWQQMIRRIELGYEAKDTVGNAQEIARWVTRHGLQQIYVVTSNYHMPRVGVELGRVLPASVQWLVVPVQPEHVVLEGWWQHKGTRTLLVGEYHKYMVAKLRALYTRFVM